MTQVLAKARQDDVFRPVSGTFESHVSGRVVRPIVHSMDSSGQDTTFNLLFVEEICSAPTHSIQPQILPLLTAVRMNNRIRWEIVERFRFVKWDHPTVDQCAQVFSRIEREVDSFGRWDLDQLCASFDPQVQPVVRAIVTRWREIRAAGTKGEQHMKGELDLAFKHYDLARIPVLIAECADLNRRFLSVANPVYEALVEQDSRGQGGADGVYGVTVA